ncbi:MAG: pentapeptide repeat-containing protein, partial [Bryobacterales bacterium]|nr:pentapeptide repeat-containing protein [Bryobacterales bacterium]
EKMIDSFFAYHVDSGVTREWARDVARLLTDWGNHLRGADLHEADLYGADLFGANLRGADLHGAIISRRFEDYVRMFKTRGEPRWVD